MNVKLDDYEVRVLINGLMQQHRSYDAETNGQIDALALRLCDIAEAMKPGRKKKIPFEPVEIRVICQCLMEWRNREIQAKRHGAVDAIAKFSKLPLNHRITSQKVYFLNLVVCCKLIVCLPEVP